MAYSKRQAIKTDAEGRPVWDKTVAQLIDTVMKDAESEGEDVVSHVVSTYDLSKEYDRRCARIYVQQQRDKRKAAEKETFVDMMKGKIPGWTPDTRPHDAQIQEITRQRKAQAKVAKAGDNKVIEIIVDAQGKTEKVINHGNTETKAARSKVVKDILTNKPAPATTETEVNKSTTQPMMYTTAHLNDAKLNAALDDFVTYGDLLEYPVLQEVSFDNERELITYKCVRGQHLLQAYAFLHYTKQIKGDFTAIVLGKDTGKVKGFGVNTFGICVSELERLVPDTTFVTKASAKAIAEPALEVVDVEATEVVEEAVVGAASVHSTHLEDIVTNYYAKVALIREAVLNYIGDAKDSEYKRMLKAKVGEVRAKAASILIGHGRSLPEPAAKKAAAAKAPAKTATKTTAKAPAGKAPTADEIREAAKAQGLDISGANFRSSKVRAELAAKLNLM